MVQAAEAERAAVVGAFPCPGERFADHRLTPRRPAVTARATPAGTAAAVTKVVTNGAATPCHERLPVFWSSGNVTSIDVRFTPDSGPSHRELLIRFGFGRMRFKA